MAIAASNGAIGGVIARQLALPLALASLVIAVIGFWLIYSAANSQDRMAAVESARIVDSYLRQTKDQAGKTARDYAWWDDAVANLEGSVGADWATENLGPYLEQAMGYGLVAVVDPAGNTTYFHQDGARRDIDLAAHGRRGLRRMVDDARLTSWDEPQPVTGLAHLGAGVGVVAAAALTPQTPPAADRRYPRSVLVLARPIDDRFLAQLSEAFGVSGLRLSAEPESPNEIAMPLVSYSSETLGRLAWRAERPGLDFLLRVGPWLVAGLALLGLIGMQLVRRASAAVAQIEAEQVLALARANGARDSVLVAMRHEVIAPLNDLLGYIDILRGGASGKISDESFRHCLQRIHQSAWSLASLINDLLDLVDLEAGVRKLVRAPVELSQIVGQVVRHSEKRAAQQGVTVRYGTPTIEPVVLGDASHLYKALRRLVESALASSRSADRIDVSLIAEADGAVSIRVQDTATSLDGAERRLAMAPLDSLPDRPRERGARAMALWLARRLVELHDGELSIDGAEGRGTAVTITLPAARRLVA